MVVSPVTHCTIRGSHCQPPAVVQTTRTIPILGQFIHNLSTMIPEKLSPQRVTGEVLAWLPISFIPLQLSPLLLPFDLTLLSFSPISPTPTPPLPLSPSLNYNAPDTIIFTTYTTSQDHRQNTSHSCLISTAIDIQHTLLDSAAHTNSPNMVINVSPTLSPP